MDMNLTSYRHLLRGISTACLLLLFIRSVYQYRALAAGLWFAMLCLGLMAYVLLPLLFEIASAVLSRCGARSIGAACVLVIL
ncbi:MAG: hypothetical protein IPG06_10440 [Haliea sp.]|nr:hypothetical protein [Haliea sp.]